MDFDARPPTHPVEADRDNRERAAAVFPDNDDYACVTMSDRQPASAPRTAELPRWARAADYLAFLLLLLAATIAISGGFRTRIGEFRLVLTGPLRLLLAAAVVGTARFALIRSDWKFHHMTARAAAAARSVPLRTAAFVALSTRTVVFAVGYLAVFMVGYAPGAEPFRDFNSELLSLPLRWDAGWYLQIATGGYSFIARAGPEAQQNIVFFPAFPMIVRALALLGGNTMAAYVLAGTLASVVLFVFALAYLYQLAREELTGEQAVAAVWLLATFPFALFVGAIYTESLYLVGALGAFHHFRKHEFVRASLWGLVVGLTRPNGFLLCLPLGLMMFERPTRVSGRAALRRMPPGALLSAAMPIAGMLIFTLFIGTFTGNPLAWAAGHAAWGRRYEGLVHLVVERYDFISHAGVGAYVNTRPYDLLNALGVVFVLVSVWPVARRFGLAYAAFILVNTLPPLAAGGLMSAGRFSSVMFPAFLWLAAVVPAPHRAGWIATFAALQAFNATLFYTWRPLF